MRLAFFSDLHGNNYTFQAFLNEVSKFSIDKMIFCGDVFGYYYDQVAILKKFQTLPGLTCLRGNHDQLFLDLINKKIDLKSLENRYGSSYRRALQNISTDLIKWVSEWPLLWKYQEEGVRICAMHGSPEDKLNGRLYPDAEIAYDVENLPYNYLVLGHTHHKMIKRKNGLTILNPGSLGQQRDGKGCSWLLFDSSQQKYSFHTVNFDRERLRKDIERNDPDNAHLIEVLYRVC